MMIAAIAVAVILVSVVFLVVDWGGDDTPDDDDDDDGTEDVMEIVATATPSGPVEAEAGDTVMFYVSSVWRNVNTSESTSIDGYGSNVTYSWSRDPIALGSFVGGLTGNRYMNFTVSDAEATGTVSCNVTYSGVYEVVSVAVTVNPPFLASVGIVPVTKTMQVGTEYVFTATAFNSVDSPMDDVEFDWTVFGLDSDDYDLNTTTGPSVTFSPSAEEDPVLLNVTATDGDISVSATSTINATMDAPPERTVDYYWYDLFEVPLGEWYFDWRLEDLGWDSSETDPPYIYTWVGSDPDNTWDYTMMMEDITGRNMPEISMNENPLFLPNFGTVTGGEAVLDWNLRYLTVEESEEWHNVESWYDGWIHIMTGTTTLDQTAAMAVLGMGSEDWDTFDTWWAVNGDQVVSDWEGWIDEQGNLIYDIYPMYDYTLQQMVTEIDAEKDGDSVVLTHRLVSWGFEALMSRWLGATFLDESENYFDDFVMHAEIHPEMTDLDITTGIQYAAYAYETTDDGLDCWMWEALLGDYLETDDCADDDWPSRYDAYADKTYTNFAPGSVLYGDEMIYDYTPGVYNLSEGETLRFTWPAGDQMFVHHVAPGDSDLVYGPMTLDYAEPMDTDFPSQITIDPVERFIEFVGPIDFYQWSKDQTAHANLLSEWTRLGLLPYGMPTLEFRIDETAALQLSADDAVTHDVPQAESDTAPLEAVSSWQPATEITSESTAEVSATSEISALIAIAVATVFVLLSLAHSPRRVENRR